MPKLRYETATGKVNLIMGDRREATPIEGMQYMTIKQVPVFDYERENLYIKRGKVIAVDETHRPPLHRIIE